MVFCILFGHMWNTCSFQTEKRQVQTHVPGPGNTFSMGLNLLSFVVLDNSGVSMFLDKCEKTVFQENKITSSSDPSHRSWNRSALGLNFF